MSSLTKKELIQSINSAASGYMGHPYQLPLSSKNKSDLIAVKHSVQSALNLKIQERSQRSKFQITYGMAVYNQALINPDLIQQDPNTRYRRIQCLQTKSSDQWAQALSLL